MTTVVVAPALLSWARERALLDPTQLAEKLNVKTPRVLEWESGDSQPTFAQLRKIASVTRVPFGLLFLPSPPELDPPPIPDLRTRTNTFARSMSIDLQHVIEDAREKQDWYRELLTTQQSEPLPFVGKFKADDGPEQIAFDIRTTLKLGADDRVRKNSESFLGHLFGKAEEAGIMVLKCGTVRGNPHRPLNPEEFQGFALCDTLVPLVFINGADFQAAQIFTFAHEIAHLWIGQSGISAQTLIPDAKAQASVEPVCNEVAAEVLVPRQELCARWQRDDGVDRNSEREARHFKVSAVVVARRALNAHLIKRDEYLAYYKAQVKLWQSTPRSERSGGDYYRSVPVRVGRTFAATVVREALEGRLLFRDAAQLLNINPGKISELAKELGVR
jgi:Zn-dependent peptidase ImmA (M78 family)